MEFLRRHYFGFILAGSVFLGATVLQAQILIVEENFGGGGGPLDTTSAETFAPAITTAGGSSTWSARSDYRDDGSLSGTAGGSAYLNVGSYINDSKGSAVAFFTATVTISGPSTGNSSYLAFGFFEPNTPDTNQSFTQAGTEGMGILIYRNTGELDGFAGPANTNNVDGPNSQTGSQTLSFDLDLTDWNGTDNFGSITFYDGSGTSFGTHEYTVTESWGSIGLTKNLNGGGATFSNFTLTQVPEPSSVALLLGLGTGMVVFLRRRRA